MGYALIFLYITNNSSMNIVDVKKILSLNGGLHKFGGVAPEGFLLVHEKTLDDLKNFDTWLLWSEGKITTLDLDKKNFDKV